MFEQVETFGKYKLIERLAVGGMAEIFRATIQGMGGVERTVAIKRLHRHLGQDDGLVQMLVDEARLAVQLQHPNIGQVFDLGCVEGQHFLVMEYIQGVDMHRLLRRLKEQRRVMPTAMAVYVMVEMLSGLHYAHDLEDRAGEPLHVVHRDISPQNVMFSTRGEVKLIDFGIAKARSQVMQTQAGIIKGKFYYMSPEQAHGQKLDRRCDVYSAGMVLYELLTGRPAYDEAGDVALLRKVRATDFEPPSHWRKDLDPNLEIIIMKALHKDLRQRFQSAQEFRAALQHYAQHHFPAITRQQAAAFLKQVLEPDSYKMASRGGELMRREDFSATDDSLIFDASHLAISMEGPAASRREAMARPAPSPAPPMAQHFASELAPGDNTFAGADEPTYVYGTEDDENPFAIPDDIPPARKPAGRASSSGPSPSIQVKQDLVDEITTPHHKSHPARPPRDRAPQQERTHARPAPAQRGPSRHKPLRIGAQPPSSGPALAPRERTAPAATAPPPPMASRHAPPGARGHDQAILDDVTIPRKVPASLQPLDEFYEPEHNPDYVAPIDAPTSPLVLGGREVTQITRPDQKALSDQLSYGFRATGEMDAASRHGATAPARFSIEPEAPQTPDTTTSLLDRAKGAIDTASPERKKKAAIAMVGALCLGVLIPFLVLSGSEPEGGAANAVEKTLEGAASNIASADQKEAEPAPKKVMLSVNSNPPGAELLLDGSVVGKTPYLIRGLRQGDNPRVTIRMKGYTPWEENVRILTLSPEPVSVTLEEAAPHGSFTVTSEPSGLVVKVDHEEVGTTPLTMPDVDTSRSYDVLVYETGSTSSFKKKTVSWGSGQPLRQNVAFAFEQEEQGDSALPAPPSKARTNKRSSRPSRRKSTRRPKAPEPVANKSSDDSSKKSLNVWGANNSNSSKADSGDGGLNVWGNKSKKQDANERGYLTVKVINGDGAIYVDGKQVQKSSPLRKHSLKPGKYKVKVYYSMLKRSSDVRTVTIKAGQTRTITFKP